MKRIFIFIASIGFPLFANAQSNVSVNGSINMPPLLQLDVNYPDNLNLEFDDLEEFAKGKVYHSCINLSVRSNSPWVVTVKSGNNNFLPLSSGNASNVPASILALKPSNRAEFVPVTNVPVPLLYSENDNVENQYTLDLQMNTPWNAEGGQYGLNFVFSISPQ